MVNNKELSLTVSERINTERRASRLSLLPSLFSPRSNRKKKEPKERKKSFRYLIFLRVKLRKSFPFIFCLALAGFCLAFAVAPFVIIYILILEFFSYLSLPNLYEAFFFLNQPSFFFLPASDFFFCSSVFFFLFVPYSI